MPQATRRLGLLGAMILVAAVAVGLAWSRFNAARPDLPGYPHRSRGVPACHWAWGYYSLAAPVMAAIAIGLLVVRFRGPSPPRRRDLSQPGASACAAVAVVLGLSAIRLLVALAALQSEESLLASLGVPALDNWWWPAYRALHPAEPGMAILACWSILALSGRMRCGRSAVECLGWVVAAYWVGATVLSWLAGQT
jgi:hypothetical protein